MKIRLTLLALLAACAAALAAGPASAATWHISPTVVNESSGNADLNTYGVVDGDFLTPPAQTLQPGNAPNQNGNTSQFEFDAPHLDEGADGVVSYNMPDQSTFNLLTQDDVNSIGTPESSSPTCVDGSPTGPLPNYSCAATFGGNGPFPDEPDASNFDPFFNFRDNSSGAPSGSRPATVAAVGQHCDAEIPNGQSVTCSAAQPSMTGFSPTDPGYYQTLYFVNRNTTPVTVTDTDPFFAGDGLGYPNCLQMNESVDDSCATSASTSCTMDGWGQTCMLQTSGGANSLAVLVGEYSGKSQAGNQVSDQISISPGANSSSGDGWYSVRIYAESEPSRQMVRGITPFGIFIEMAGAYANAWSQSRDGPPVYWDPSSGDDVVASTASVRPGATLAPGRALRRGPFRVTMRKDGNLVEDVAENGHRFPVWSSGTRSPGAHATLGHDGNLVVRGRDGRVKWSTKTHGKRVAQLGLDKDGRLVLRATNHRALFATAAVAYPLPVKDGSRAVTRGLGLAPGGQLRAGALRLTMRTNGNLVLTRRGKALWSSKTAGNPGAYARLRPDGDFVVADQHGKVLWSTRTHGSRAARLTLRKDGSLVMYDKHHRKLWSATA